VKLQARGFFVLCLIFFFFPTLLEAQTYVHPNRWEVDSLIILSSDEDRFLIPETHRIQSQTFTATRQKLLLQADVDYRFESENKVCFFGLSNADTLRIRYRRQPVLFKSSYNLYQSVSTADSSTQDSVVNMPLKRVKLENPFAQNNTSLNTSGSLMRGVQIGTNRDFNLNSGLNLELSGKLTENLEVIAALTDEATPIQPEGNTQTLNEVDKVFVEFKSPYVQGTVGDFNLHYKNSEFANLTRKLQGISLTGKYKQQQLNGTVATTRGLFNRMIFLGQEGLQGPYQLNGMNGERDIIVLAGTERIWINGVKMTRGESNDYSIEYGNGQIRFTSRRLITSASRIEVDFEYYPANQKYNRNVYSVLSENALYGNNLQLRLQAYRETDDPRQLLDAGDAVDADEKKILRGAGDDPLLAFSAGETYLAEMSGSYLKRDTTWQEQSYTYFKYVGKNSGDYNVSFSDVGLGKGDYNRDRLGIYFWVGPKSGRYLPIRLLGLPERHDLADLQLKWQPFARGSVSLEYAVSRKDKNILSDKDDADNNGTATQFKTNLEQYPLKTSRINLGLLTFDTQFRYVQDAFQAADRFQAADFQRYWNLPGTDQAVSEEKSFQGDLLYKPIKNVSLSVNAGRLQRSGFESDRYQGQLTYSDQQSNYKLGYESVSSDIQTLDSKNIWNRVSTSAERNIWKFKPYFRFNSEHRRNDRDGLISGFRFDDYGAQLGLYRWKYAEGSVEINKRFDSVYDYKRADELLPQANTITERLQLKLINLSQTTADIQLVHRKKDFSKQFENIKVDTLILLYADASVQDTVWQDRSTNLAEINLSQSGFKKAFSTSIQYRISSEQTALKEKVYLDVGQGRGNLRFDSELQEYVPDVDGEYLLFVLPSGKFEPVTTVQSVWRLKLDPGRYWKKNSDPLVKLLRYISSETYFRVEEESQEENLWDLYLLNLSKFQGDHTVRGSTQLNQDLHIMRRNRKLSFRLRYRHRKSSSNQFLEAGENENRKSDEIGLRASWRLAGDLKGQTELRNRTTFRNSAANPLRNRDILGWYGNQNLSYRPFRQWELGLEGEYGQEENRVESYPVALWYGQMKSRLSYALPENGRATAEYQYQTVQLTDNPFLRTVPYQMARGKKEGVSQTWQARFEYTMVKNVVFSLFYSGRNEAGFEKVIHSGQAEVRAFF